jgi:hypothetical protein
MLQRCNNHKYKRFKDWGGRGITVCARWQGEDGFANFLADMGKRPSLKHGIDRINNDGNYEPSNCRWAINKQQCNNKRNNRLLTFQGRTQTVTQWSEEIGLSRDIISDRLSRNWPIELTLTLPVRHGQKVITSLPRSSGSLETSPSVLP